MKGEIGGDCWNISSFHGISIELRIQNPYTIKLNSQIDPPNQTTTNKKAMNYRIRKQKEV